MVIDEGNPSDIYVSNDVGVFRTRNGGKRWERLGGGLPEVQVYDMRLFYPKNGATKGRGIWEQI